jgi:TolA-binding protein
MKSTERHRLKENEVAYTVLRARENLEVYRKPIIAGLVIVALAVAVAAGLVYWRQRVDTHARALLAEAMAVADAPVAAPPAPGTANPPAPQPGSYPTEQAKHEAALQKFMVAADAHPSSTAGVAARYHAAATLVALGRTKEAVQRYQEVVDRAGSSIYADMARLGLANAQAAAGQYDTAINTYKELSGRKDGPLPVDGVLMQLGRTYARAGKLSDARQTFKRIVDEFPQSPYASLATREIEQIKG